MPAAVRRHPRRPRSPCYPRRSARISPHCARLSGSVERGLQPPRLIAQRRPSRRRPIAPRSVTVAAVGAESAQTHAQADRAAWPQPRPPSPHSNSLSTPTRCCRCRCCMSTRGPDGAGGSLGFAPSGDAPVLFDSALGRVTLYFRDDAGQFLLAYYDTFTGRAMLHLPAEPASSPSWRVRPPPTTTTCRSRRRRARDSDLHPGGDAARRPVPVTETWTGCRGTPHSPPS